MKRILIASAVALAAGGQALAADLPPPAPMPLAPATYVPIVAPPYNWTGFYIGANSQFWGGVVVGAEAMFDWLPNTKNTVTLNAAGAPIASATINNRWLTT